MKHEHGHGSCSIYDVAPFTGAWIDTIEQVQAYKFKYVAPFTGAWIETVDAALTLDPDTSLPSRERGLKHVPLPGGAHHPVAPFTGAWIETLENPEPGKRWRVAPFTGAWIETHL